METMNLPKFIIRKDDGRILTKNNANTYTFENGIWDYTYDLLMNDDRYKGKFIGSNVKS